MTALLENAPLDAQYRVDDVTWLRGPYGLWFRDGDERPNRVGRPAYALPAGGTLVVTTAVADEVALKTATEAHETAVRDLILVFAQLRDLREWFDRAINVTRAAEQTEKTKAAVAWLQEGRALAEFGDQW